jgi:hypothetical protein
MATLSDKSFVLGVFLVIIGISVNGYLQDAYADNNGSINNQIMMYLVASIFIGLFGVRVFYFARRLSRKDSQLKAVSQTSQIHIVDS